MSKQNVAKMVELARAHVEAGGIRAAEVYYRMIQKATEVPATGLERIAAGEAFAFFAARAIADGRHGAACDFYQRAVGADPLCVEYRLNFIIRALLPMGMFKNARIMAECATRIEPENKDAWRALAICCAALGEEEASAAAYDRQVQLDPGNPLARLDRATLALNTGDYETALRMTNEQVLESEHRGEGMHMLGLIAYRQSHHEAAIAFYDRALDAGVQDPEQVKWNKSLALHAIGEYPDGFALAESRGKQQADHPMRLVMNRFQQPALAPEDMTRPCRVHVHQEMGNGDAIATARYLDLLTDLGHEVTLETMDSLVDLLQRSFPKVRVLPRAIDYPGAIGVPPFDRHVTTLSLPYLFGTTIDTVPWRGPYLKPDPERVAAYRAQLSSKRMNVGVCWSSGIRHDAIWISRYGRMKSMRLAEMAPMLRGNTEHDDYFVSLQVGPERAERSQYPVSLRDILPAKPSWDDTAALIACLDVVVTVDTAVAHLAGALGKPVLLLMQADGATWHFMCERPGAPWNEASPWYPSVRIFRQRERGEWRDVVERASAALHEKQSMVA